MCARGVEERFFLSDFEARSDATVVARIHKFKALLEGVNGAAEKSDLSIELTKGEIISGEFRDQDEAHILEIGGVGLKGGLRGFKSSAALAEKVDFVTHREGERVTVLCDRAGQRSIRTGGARPGETLAIGGRVD